MLWEEQCFYFELQFTDLTDCQFAPSPVIKVEQQNRQKFWKGNSKWPKKMKFNILQSLVFCVKPENQDNFSSKSQSQRKTKDTLEARGSVCQLKADSHLTRNVWVCILGHRGQINYYMNLVYISLITQKQCLYSRATIRIKARVT